MGISTPAVTLPTYLRPQGGYSTYTPPAAPTSLSASVSGSNVTLNWVSNSTNETGFQVERATASGGPWSVIATKAAGVTSHADTSLADGTYYYQVKALRSAQSSGYAASAPAVVVTLPVAPVLGTPAITGSTATVTFTGGSNFTTLIPQYRLVGAGVWTSIANDMASPLTYSGLAAGNYEFRALANGSTGYPSNTVTGTVALSGSLTLVTFDNGSISAPTGPAPAKNTNNLAFVDQVSVSVQSSIGYGGSHGLRFRYPPGANQWSECKFSMNPMLDAWFKFRLRVPTNFTQGGMNNKLLTLYMGPHDTDYSHNGDGPTILWETWGLSGGSNELAVHWSEGNHVAGGPHTAHTNWISNPGDRGRWMTVVTHVKASTVGNTPRTDSGGYSTAANNDGVIQLWRRWDGDSSYTQIHNITNANIYPRSSTSGAWSHGYLMGWANASYDPSANTDWVVDDFEISSISLLT